MTERTTCFACLMPFSKDTGNRTNKSYCSYCQQDGEFRFTGTRKEFQSVSYNSMRKNGMNPLVAKFFAWTIRFAPQWKQ